MAAAADNHDDRELDRKAEADAARRAARYERHPVDETTKREAFEQDLMANDESEAGEDIELADENEARD